MKKYISLFIFVITVNSSNAQSGIYTAAEIRTKDSFSLSVQKTFTINGVEQIDKSKYFIKTQSSSKPQISGKYTKGKLFFNVNNIEGVLKIVSPSNNNGKLIINKKNDESLANPTSPLIVKTIINYTGIAYWDAKIILNSKVDSNEKQDILKIINQYTKDGKSDWSKILENPFFKKSTFFKNIEAGIKTTMGVNSQSNNATIAGQSGGLLGSLSGLDVTKYVQAFADFLRDRIKEELTTAYLKKLRDTIEASAELKILLPKTRTVFLSNDAFAIPSMGATYKAAFAEDLDNLLPNFEKMIFVIDKEPYISLRTNEGFVSAIAAYHFVEMTSKNYHPSDILAKLNSQFEFKDESSTKISYAIAVTNMLSQHLLDTSGSKWIDKNVLKNFTKDEAYIFLGLLYEKYPTIFNAKIGSLSLTDLLSKEEEIENKTLEKISNFLSVANAMDERIKIFKQAIDKKETVLTNFINNSDAFMETLDYVVTLAGLFKDNKTDYYKWKTIIQHALDATKATQENNIGKLGINFISIITELLPNKINLNNNIIEYVKVLTDLTNAKTSKDIKAVLVSYAAPVHSYRVARSYARSTCIAAYPGLYAGYEGNSFKSSKGFAFGVTAPIGISLNAGALTNKNVGRSNSLFISIFDIGAALSYRWANDTVDIPNKITLGQIFSPGISYIRGFKESPLAFKVGLQYSPQLRQIRDGANVLAENSGVVRFSIGLSVDIPLFILSYKK